MTARITLLAGVQALKLRTDAGQCSFDSMTFAAPASTASAAFVKADTTTQGNWKGVYGADGYDLPSDQSGVPASPNPKRPPFVSDSTTGGSYTWAATTTDPRALRQAGGAGRIAAQWYGNPSLDIDCPLTDGRVHQVAVYALDWDNFQGGRSETVQVLDAGSGAVLDSRTLAAGPSFVSGTYLVWNVRGHVLFHVVRNSGVNATLSGLFFDPAGGPVPAR